MNAGQLWLRAVLTAGSGVAALFAGLLVLNLLWCSNFKSHYPTGVWDGALAFLVAALVLSVLACYRMVDGRPVGWIDWGAACTWIAAMAIVSWTQVGC
jgi:hypothetical protein